MDTGNSVIPWWLERPSGEKIEFGFRESIFDKLIVEYPKTVRPVKSWAEELEIAAEKIIEDNNGKVSFFYSGGADSEVMLRTFLKIGKVPPVHIIKFADGSNSHETDTAEEFCRCFGVTPTYHLIDIVRFLRSDAVLQMGVDYQATQPAFLTFFHVALKLDYPAIISGEPYCHRMQSPGIGNYQDQWFRIFREDEDGCWNKFESKTGCKISPEALCYTPELVQAWLTSPIIRDVLSKREKATLLSSKKKSYEHELGIKILAEKKYHGFERHYTTLLHTKQKLESLIPRLQIHKTPITDIWNEYGIQNPQSE